MKYFTVTVCLLLLLPISRNAFADDRWKQASSLVVSPTVAIRITWTEKEGEVPKVSHGTGFLISAEGHYMTTAHIIPAGVDPKNLLIEAELRPFQQKMQGPVALNLVGIPDRSALVDAAVLQDTTKSIKATPLAYKLRIPSPPEELLINGYAGESGSETNIDRVAGEGADGTIKMNAFVKEGFSGSPVVDSEGYVVGMIRGGDPVAQIDPTTKVMGKALFVPVARIVNKMPTLAGFKWTDSASSIGVVNAFAKRRNTTCILGFCFETPSLTGIFAKQASNVKDPPVTTTTEMPSVPLKQTRSVDVTKDDHPILLAPSTENYPPITVNAFAGYKIVDAKFTAYSANGAKYSAQVSEDFNSASFAYTLTSGPMVDQYRGWLKGDFVVTMIPK